MTPAADEAAVWFGASMIEQLDEARVKEGIAYLRGDHNVAR